MRQNIRRDDVAARVGGDEFLIFVEYRGNVMPQIERIFRSLTDSFQGFRYPSAWA